MTISIIKLITMMTFGNLSEVHKVRTCSKLAHSTPGKKIRTMEGKDAVSQQMLNSNIMEESKIRSLRWQYNNMLKIYTLYRNQVYTQLNRGTVILLYTLLKYQDCFGNSTLYFKGKYSTKKINLDENGIEIAYTCSISTFRPSRFTFRVRSVWHHFYTFINQNKTPHSHGGGPYKQH